MLDEGRQRRLASNEARFREINEALEEELRRLCADDELVSFVCECARPDCREAVELTCDEYAAVRADPTHFAVRPGHELQSVERVISDHGRYRLIAKVDAGADEARRRDTRDG